MTDIKSQDIEAAAIEAGAEEGGDRFFYTSSIRRCRPTA